MKCTHVQHMQQYSNIHVLYSFWVSASENRCRRRVIPSLSNFIQCFDTSGVKGYGLQKPVTIILDFSCGRLAQC